MTFEEFHNQNPHYSYLVAKIYYNIEKEKMATHSSLLASLVVSFTPPTAECESCSA